WTDRDGIPVSFGERTTELDVHEAEDALAGVLLNAKDLQDRMDVGHGGLERPALADAVAGPRKGFGRCLLQFGRQFPVSLAELLRNDPFVGRVRLFRTRELLGVPSARGADPSEVDGEGIL